METVTRNESRSKKLSQELYAGLGKILNDELIMALGCTEPTCIAYCSARMRELLGRIPERILVQCSGNIIKNVEGATVPNSGGMKGIEAAAILGSVGGDPSKQLEVLTTVTEKDILRTRELLSQKICSVGLLNTTETLCVIVRGEADGHSAEAELRGSHTNITRLEKDGSILFESEGKDTVQKDFSPFCYELTIDRILDYSETVDLDLYNLTANLEQQIECNSQIAAEGIENNYGASVGKTMLHNFGDSVSVRACAYAAAASDARMSGCELPVVINSGSGNQGITVSIPVIVFAKELKVSHETLLRALLIANLTAIHIKVSYGRLSAFCGAVSAAAGSGAAITWLRGGTREQIGGTVINTLGSVAGIVCDGAKPSCASKIANAVNAALIAESMSLEGKEFSDGDGLVCKDVESTIHNFGRMAAEGMAQTDQKILQLMVGVETDEAETTPSSVVHPPAREQNLSETISNPMPKKMRNG